MFECKNVTHKCWNCCGEGFCHSTSKMFFHSTIRLVCQPAMVNVFWYSIPSKNICHNTPKTFCHLTHKNLPHHTLKFCHPSPRNFFPPSTKIFSVHLPKNCHSTSKLFCYVPPLPILCYPYPKVFCHTTTQKKLLPLLPHPQNNLFTHPSNFGNIPSKVLTTPTPHYFLPPPCFHPSSFNIYAWKCQLKIN